MIETNESKTDINISINCQPINQIFTKTSAKKIHSTDSELIIQLIKLVIKTNIDI